MQELEQAACRDIHRFAYVELGGGAERKIGELTKAMEKADQHRGSNQYAKVVSPADAESPNGKLATLKAAGISQNGP